jgi:hypothetical protein
MTNLAASSARKPGEKKNEARYKQGSSGPFAVVAAASAATHQSFSQIKWGGFVIDLSYPEPNAPLIGSVCAAGAE